MQKDLRHRQGQIHSRQLLAELTSIQRCVLVETDKELDTAAEDDRGTEKDGHKTRQVQKQTPAKVRGKGSTLSLFFLLFHLLSEVPY